MADPPRPGHRWLKPSRHTKPGARWRLVCMAHAGGGAASFGRWPLAAPAGLELLRVQLPGREEAHGLPCLGDLRDAVAPLRAAVLALPEAHRPMVLYGHSLGAVLACLLARRLEAEGRGPAGLIVSGRRAPHLPPPKPDLHELPEAEFAAVLAAAGGFQGLSPRTAGDPVLLGLVRRDLEALARVPVQPERALRCPVTVFHGSLEPWVSDVQAAAWARATTGPFRLCRYEGGHFDHHGARGAIMAAALALAGGAEGSLNERRA